MAAFGPTPGERLVAERSSYRIDENEASVSRERERLRALTTARDPQTIRVLSEIEVAPGWRCLEVGAGSGSIARWLVDRVSPDGHVLSVDIDLRFHCDAVPGMEVRELDIVRDETPPGPFDLVHARALLQHLEQRESVLDRLVDALSPGGWIVIEDSYWQAFEEQPLPEPLDRVAEVMHRGLRAREGWDPNVGSRLLRMFAERGLADIDVFGEVRTMRGGHESGSWWYLGIEHAADRLVAHGAVTQGEIDEAIRIVRSPDFVMMSPVSISARGRISA
jgi:SAM-dependent methyltransferase